ncbi:DUF3048 domain-containing protein [Demequina pelophila]|uniref:DUF3048 domain-containing protein n=1 Tax=Demequina pelophila TaxID=1638984 RepID=UPI000781D21B|nr:DUF3048 domain-containing protein [Demequina pelophila]
MSKTRLSGALAAAGALTLLAACAPATTTSSAPQATVSVSVEPSIPSLPEAPEDPRPEVVWPLTGIEAADVDQEDLDRPALSIKIENSSAARPQENLDKADVVFEEYVEYGISRLIAVYHSDYPDSVGPIRSMRPMDKNIMGSFAGPLVFSGAQARFVSATQNSGQKVIAQDVGSSGFYRTSGRAAPHNLHGYPAEFARQASDMPAPEAQWEWAFPAETATAQLEGEAASVIDITMSSQSQPEWRWDADADAWMRYEGSSPHVTMDGTQLSATNVVALWVEIKYTSSNGGSSVPETLVAGKSGTGYVASGDQYIPINWSKAGQYDPFVFATESGDPVSFMPGQTWVELIPNKGIDHATAIDIS